MGADRVRLRIHGVQLGAQRLDVRVDCPVAAVQRVAPDAVHQLRAAQHRAGPLQERGEQAVFVARQVEPAAAVADAMAVGVVFEAAVVRRGQLTSVLVGAKDIARVRLVNVSGAEGLAGLSEGDVVIVDAPSTVSDGRRVRPGGR